LTFNAYVASRSDRLVVFGGGIRMLSEQAR